MKITIAEYAAKILAPQYQMPLMTIQEACEKVGWEFVDKPACCGVPVELRSFLGDVYSGHCKACGRFVQDIVGPQFTGAGSVRFIDADKVDTEADYAHRWIAGIGPEE
jgi:hypothetical protein